MMHRNFRMFSIKFFIRDMSTQRTEDHRLFRIKFSVEEEGKEVGRASLCIIFNDGHEGPYGLLEDVFVEEAYRGRGYGRELIHAVIDEAKKQKCRKIRATSRNSRPEVHAMYEKYGFEKYGAAFKMELE